MNAIDLLETQHRKVEDLFEKLEKARTAETKRRYFEELADSLAVHAAIEEHQFYPTVKAKRTEDILLESLEEHLAMKRVLADLLATDVKDETFDAKVTVLKEEVSHHVEEEEEELFPKVRKLLSKEQLEALGQEMTAEQIELEEAGDPRHAVPAQTEHAATL